MKQEFDRRIHVATMTMAEADRIIDIVYAAFEDTSHRHLPISALQGYDIYQIYTAFKLRIAYEFLLLVERENFEQIFEDGLKHYDAGPWHICSRFVPDDQIDSLDPVSVFELIDGSTMELKQRFASEETGTSFGNYCRSLGADHPIYWQKVYTRLGLEYTSTSPKGNTLYFAKEFDEVTSQPSILKQVFTRLIK